MYPVVQRGCGELHAKIGVLFDLTVFGQMVTVFIYNHLREQICAHMVATEIASEALAW